MYKPIHLIPAGTRIDFMRFHKPAFILSVIMVIGSFVLIFTKGLNYGIDFAGGVLMEVQQEQAVDLAQLRGQLDGLNIGEITLQTFGAPNDVLIRIPQQAGGDQATQDAVAKIKTTLGDKWQYRRTETVGPKVGSELKSSAVWASFIKSLIRCSRGTCGPDCEPT